MDKEILTKTQKAIVAQEEDHLIVTVIKQPNLVEN